MGSLEMMDVAIFVVSFSSTSSCDIREYLINLKKTTEIIVITGFFFVCVCGGLPLGSVFVLWNSGEHGKGKHLELKLRWNTLEC